MEKSKIEVNDIIICMTGGTVGKSLYIKQLDEPSYLNQRVALIRAKDKLSDYLAHVFKSPYIQELVKDNITSTNDNISMNFLNNILIPIPPFNEQLRIQSKFSYCEPLIQNYEQSERKLTQLELEFEEKLKTSILQYAIEGKLVKQDSNDEPASKLLERIKAEKERLIQEGKIKRDKSESNITFGDDKNYYRKYLKSGETLPIEINLFDIPTSWMWATLGEISRQISDGTHKTPKYVIDGIPFLSIINISSGKYDGRPKYITLDEHQQLIKRCKPELNDILLCRIGTLGKPFINNLNFDYSIFVSLGLIKLIDKNLVQFIKFVLESPLSYKFIEKVKVGGGTHTFKINVEDIYSFPIPVPPLQEQKRIIDQLNQISTLFSLQF